jgi:histidinol phosphatase-like enzyme
MSKIAIFLDKDGTFVSDVPYTNDPQRANTGDATGTALSRLYETGCEVVPVSNHTPHPGMILRAAFDLDLDIRRSWLLGETLDSIEAGRRAGCHTILINNGKETEWTISAERQPHFIVSNLDEAARTILSILKYKNEDLFALDVDVFSLMVE